MPRRDQPLYWAAAAQGYGSHGPRLRVPGSVRSSHQAHVPAKETQEGPHAWFQGAHADARRPDGFEATSQQGTLASDGLAVAARQKRRRLSRSAEFDRVYRRGRSTASRHLVLYAFPREGEASQPQLGADADGPRLGVSAGRRVGGAVVRNRVKRSLREAFWALGDKVPDQHDYVVVARAEAKALVEGEGSGGVERELEQLLDQLAPRVEAKDGE